MTILSDAPTDVDLFGRPLPRHTTVRPMTRQCLICGLRGPRTVDAPHRLCEHCAASPHMSRTLCETHLARIAEAEQAAYAAWIDQQANVDDDTAERWTALVQTRQIAAVQLQRARTGSRPRGDTAEALRARAQAAEAAWQAVQGKIARTRARNPAIAALLDAEAAHQRTLRTLAYDRQRWEMALSDVDVLLEEIPL